MMPASSCYMLAGCILQVPFLATEVLCKKAAGMYNLCMFV